MLQQVKLLSVDGIKLLNLKFIKFEGNDITLWIPQIFTISIENHELRMPLKLTIEQCIYIIIYRKILDKVTITKRRC